MKTKHNRLVLLVATLVLGGCAYAPGLYTGNGSSGPTWLNPGVVAADDPPAGALRSITPELVRNQRASQVDVLPDAVKELFATPTAYLIGSGDLINIVVWDHPQLSMAGSGATPTGNDATGASASAGNGFNVNPDGMIQFPYVGAIKLAGLTEYQARDLLTSRLRKFIKDPQITVRVQAYRSGRVYIDGEVRTPGLQAVTDIPMTLPEAISRAGGFTPTADRASIAITRNGQTAMVSLPQLIAKGINPTGILLRHGDLLRVLGREDAKVFVLGEVLRPSTQSLRNGRLTLNEALSEAGGINPNSADPRQIFVVRTVTPDQPEIYHLDAKSPFAYAVAEGFELKIRDVIYVDPVPLVRWNRVISLILPSAQAVTSTRVVTGN
jgi:polysaccharide export outer membrane protein